MLLFNAQQNVKQLQGQKRKGWVIGMLGIPPTPRRKEGLKGVSIGRNQTMQHLHCSWNRERQDFCALVSLADILETQQREDEVVPG